MVKIQRMKLEDIMLAEHNPKQHDIGAIITSIRTFGFVSPLIMNEGTGRLVAGHGRFEALRQMWSENEDRPEGISAKDGSWQVPVVRGVKFESDEAALAYLVADNRLTELGGWEEAELAEVLHDLGKAVELVDFEVTGFDGEDLERMIENLDGIVDDVDAEEAKPKSPIVCPSCGHEWVK